MRDALTLAAGAVLVALVIVLLWPQEDWGVPTVKDAEAVASVSPAQGVPPDVVAPEPSPIETIPYSEEVEEPSWTEEEVLRVRVVERESGACVPGATVIVSKCRRTLSHPQGFPLPRQGPHAAERSGRTWVTDHNGEAETRGTIPLYLAARKGDLYGNVVFDDALAAEVVIEAMRGPTLAARALRPDGRPLANVPVTFTVEGRGGGSSSSTWRRVVSRADGLATAGHMSALGRGPSQV